MSSRNAGAVYRSPRPCVASLFPVSGQQRQIAMAWPYNDLLAAATPQARTGYYNNSGFQCGALYERSSGEF